MACKKSEQTKQAHSLLLSLSCEGQLCCAINYLYNCVLWARCSKERRSRNFIVSTYKYDIVSWWYNTTVYVKYIIHTYNAMWLTYHLIGCHNEIWKHKNWQIDLYCNLIGRHSIAQVHRENWLQPSDQMILLPLKIAACNGLTN